MAHEVFLLVALLLLPAAAAASSPHPTSPAGSVHAHGHHHGHHHGSPMTTATARTNTAPSMHQNHLESEETQSLHGFKPFIAVAARAPSGEGATTAAKPTRLDPTQAPSPPPYFDSAADLTSPTPSQPQAEAESSASGLAAAPPLDEPATTTTPLPPPNPDNSAASAAEAMVASSDDMGLQQLAKVLASLGYNEMASAASRLADSPSVAGWTGAITVFASPDSSLLASCPRCSRRHLLLEHIALGYYPDSELTAAATVNLLPSASVGLCLNVAAQQGPFVINHVNLYVDGVEVAHPEMYNDGRLVVHGLHGFVAPLSRTSCYEATHQLVQQRRHNPRPASPDVVRFMIRQAMSRLRDGGFGFVSLAMRVNLAELEKLTNLTVFALDDQAVFSAGGGYVSAVRFHIIPGLRLTRANLLQLRPGTKLPTLAGADQKLFITLGADSDEVHINYVPVKEPDVVVNSRVAVHGICVPFPGIHQFTTQLQPGVKMQSATGAGDHQIQHRHEQSVWEAGFAGVALAAVLIAVGFVFERRRRLKLQSALVAANQNPDICLDCGVSPNQWRVTCCGYHYCSSCVTDGFLDSHVNKFRKLDAQYPFCGGQGDLEPIEFPAQPEFDTVLQEYFFNGYTTRDTSGHTKTFINRFDLLAREVPRELIVTYQHDNRRVNSVVLSPKKKVLPMG